MESFVGLFYLLHELSKMNGMIKMSNVKFRPKEEVIEDLFLYMLKHTRLYLLSKGHRHDIIDACMPRTDFDKYNSKQY